ncbi:MAG: chemotaxis protein CheB [Luteibaculaceae bacterium]
MLTTKQDYKAIVIGGSAGSFQVVTAIVEALPENYAIPIIFCLHRLRNVREGFVEALQYKSKLPVVEPYDKQKIKPGSVYLAPSNYHLSVELGNTFALSAEDLVNFSRPSIDISFYSVAYTFKAKAIGIILSGANKDGAHGIKKIQRFGGYTIVQEPSEATITTMPDSALSLIKPDKILNTQEIIKFLLEVGKVQQERNLQDLRQESKK